MIQPVAVKPQFKTEGEYKAQEQDTTTKNRKAESRFIHNVFGEHDEEEEISNEETKEETLRRQLLINKRTHNFTIHSVLGGNPQDCDCTVAVKHLNDGGIQKKLVDEGLLDEGIRVFFCGKTSLHPQMPGGLKGIKKRQWGMIHSQMRRVLRQANLPLTHLFPVFWSKGDGEWKYIGHYRIWDPKDHVKDDDVFHVPIDCDGNEIDMNGPASRYLEIASFNDGVHGEAWVNALSKKQCGWESSLTTFQKSASSYYNDDDGDDVGKKNLSEQVLAGYEYLQSTNMLSPDGGTNEQRKNATRKLLHDGACTLEWECLEFVKYDDKLHTLLQKRASGVHSDDFPSGIRKTYLAKKEAKQKKKNDAEDRKISALEDAEDAEKGRGMVRQIKVVQIKTEKKKAKKKKRTIEQVEESSKPKDGGKRLRRSEEIKRIEMEWPCEDDSMEWFSGTLHTSFQNGKQFITFDNKNRKYHVASVKDWLFVLHRIR